MPFDFTASELVVVQEKLQEVFQDGHTTQERSKPPLTALRLLQGQTAKVEKLFSGTTCIGHEVNYMFVDSVVVPTVTTTPDAAACQIPVGKGSSSAKKSFAPNLYLKSVIEVRDKDCDNLFKFLERFTHLLASEMALFSQAINEYLIAQLAVLAETPTYVGDGTLAGAIIEYPAASFTPDLLADWDLVANNNLLASDYMILHGTNFRNQLFNANFKQLNDNERSLLPQLTHDGKASWDIKQLDQIIGAPTSFLVDKHVLAFFNRSTYMDQMEELKDENSTTTFRLPLMYFSGNPSPERSQNVMQYANDGMMETVWVDIRYQRICNSTETDGGRTSLTHRWELICENGFDIAPSTNARTGIIQIEKV